MQLLARPSYSPLNKSHATRCPKHFFINDTATTEIYTLSLHDALPIWLAEQHAGAVGGQHEAGIGLGKAGQVVEVAVVAVQVAGVPVALALGSGGNDGDAASAQLGGQACAALSVNRCHTAIVLPSGVLHSPLNRGTWGRTAGVRLDSVQAPSLPQRSEERRVGKESRSRWSPYH